MKTRQDYDEAIAELRKRIDEQAARLGEMSKVLEDLFDSLYELEAEMELEGVITPQEIDEMASNSAAE